VAAEYEVSILTWLRTSMELLPTSWGRGRWPPPPIFCTTKMWLVLMGVSVGGYISKKYVTGEACHDIYFVCYGALRRCVGLN
jgi:hypothetical protein